MTKRFLGFLFVGIFFFGPFSSGWARTTNPVSFTQISAFNCDFDDNIMFTDAKIYVWDTVAKKEIPVSTQDWALVKTKLGQEGPWKNGTLRPESFRHFADESELGDDVVKVQVEKALENVGPKALAPSFAAMKAALENKVTRDTFFIITARENSPQAILKGFQVLKDRGYVTEVPRVENIFPVGWKQLPREFKGETHSASKAKVMLQLLDNVQKVPVPPDAALVDDREGKGKAKLHLWGFSDDDFDNFKKAKDVLSAEVAKGRWPNVKISLYFTGLNNPNEKARNEVIKSSGKTRPPTKNEASHMTATL